MSEQCGRRMKRAVTTRRLAGAGVAGVAAAFAVTPFAAAAAASPAADTTATASPDPSAPTTPANGVRRAASTQEDVQPNYGFQKIRVGVQIKSGAWVPPGTTTAGTEITITETGDFADEQNGGPKVTTCTTQASTETSGSTATYCRFGNTTDIAPDAQQALAAPAQLDPNDYYPAGPGDTVTVKQTTVEPHLLIDPEPQTFGPCTTTSGPICDNSPQLALFTDPGLPPAASDDSATTPENTAVTVDVLRNDDAKGAPVTVAVQQQPAHGSATVVGSEIRYTPDHGFTGKDAFTYRITTANGTATATVSITVTPVAATTPPPPSTGPTTAPIANTGAPDTELAELGGLLLIAGGLATAAGRRRYRARHTAD